MFLNRLKLAGVAILAAGLVAGGTVAVGYSVLAGDPPAKADQAKGEKPAPANEEAQALQKSRVAAEKAAHDAFDGAYNALGNVVRIGTNLFPIVKPEEAYIWSVRWLQAKLDLCDKKADRLAAYEEHLKRVKLIQARTNKMSPTIIPLFESAGAAWYVAEAEIWLAKEKGK